MAYKALSELVVVFSKQLKLKIRTKVGFANSASDLFSILLNFHASYLFCNVHMSLQRLLPSTTPLPPIGSSVSSVFLLEELQDLLLKHSVQIECTEDLYSSWKVFWRGTRVRQCVAHFVSIARVAIYTIYDMDTTVAVNMCIDVHSNN